MVGELHLSHCVDFIIIRGLALLREQVALDEARKGRYDVTEAIKDMEHSTWRSFTPCAAISLRIDQAAGQVYTIYHEEILTQLSILVEALFNKITAGEIIVRSLDENSLSAKVSKTNLNKANWCFMRDGSRFVVLDAAGNLGTIKGYPIILYDKVIVPDVAPQLTDILFGNTSQIKKSKPGPKNNSIRNEGDKHLHRAIKALWKKDPDMPMAKYVRIMRKDESLTPYMSGTDIAIIKRMHRHFKKGQT